jgi:hypothetical protein
MKNPLPILSVVMAATLCPAQERALTTAPHGHQIHHRQVFSPDGRFIYYDARNDETQLARSTFIGRVEVATGREEILYRVPTPTAGGPGVGAVTCDPASGRLAFIHGLDHPSAAQAYAPHRRSGVSLTPDGRLIHLDARDVTPPFTGGALSGGTHAFHWSPDGARISFTYNDALIPIRPAPDDLRTVGIMIPGRPVTVETSDPGVEFSGEAFATLVVPVTATPAPGSDEISRACDEGWLGTTHLAFQGTVRAADGRMVTELFLATLPPAPGATLRLADGPPVPPPGMVIRRLTHTEERKFPGIQGPRHWVRPAPDRSLIAFLAKDDQGIAQIFAVGPDGGPLRQLSRLTEAVETPFDWSPDSKFLACSAGGRIRVIEVATGNHRTLTADSLPGQEPRYSVTFSPDGRLIAFNRLLPHPNGGTFLQIQAVDPG